MAAQLLAGIAQPENRSKFETVMNGIDALILREADTTEKLKALEKANN